MSPERICSAVLYIAEAITAGLYFKVLFAPKKTAKVRVTLLTIVYFLLWLSFQLGNFFVNALLFFAGNLVLILLCYATGKTAAILHAAFMTLIMIITEVIVMVLLSSIFGDFGAFTYNLIAQIVTSVLSKILYFSVILAFSRIYGSRRKAKEEPYFVLLICLLPAASMVISIMIMYVGVTVPLTGCTEALMMVSVFLLLFVNIVVLAVNDQIQKIYDDRTALQLRLQKEEADVNYYHMLQVQYDNQRLLIHDIKDQFRVIEGLARENKNEEIIDYLYRFEAKPELSNQIRLCDNSVLNAILVWYADQCRQNGITYHCDVRADCVSFLDPNSITALFGNLLSNAFEAACLSARKSIEVSVVKRPVGGVILSIVNSCDSKPPKDLDGNLKTTKKDTEHHGLGLKSVNKVIQQYGGFSTLYYDDAEKSFHCIIRFPAEAKAASLKF